MVVESSQGLNVLITLRNDSEMKRSPTHEERLRNESVLSFATTVIIRITVIVRFSDH